MRPGPATGSASRPRSRPRRRASAGVTEPHPVAVEGADAGCALTDDPDDPVGATDREAMSSSSPLDASAETLTGACAVRARGRP